MSRLVAGYVICMHSDRVVRYEHRATVEDMYRTWSLRTMLRLVRSNADINVENNMNIGDTLLPCHNLIRVRIMGCHLVPATSRSQCLQSLVMLWVSMFGYMYAGAYQRS
jgi:hypothetical protein